MSTVPWLALPILIPLLSALLLALPWPWRIAAWINIGATVVTMAASVRLIWLTDMSGDWLGADVVTVHLAVLVSLVALAASLQAPAWLDGEIRDWRMPASAAARHLALFQALLAALLLTVLARDPALIWMAVVVVVLALHAAAALRDAPSARIAGRALLGLGAVGLLLALCGMMLLGLASAPPVGWEQLLVTGGHSDGAGLSLAFVLLLLGGTTIAGVALWSSGTHASPLTGLQDIALAGIMLVGLARLRGVLTGHAGALAPGPVIIALGVVALLTGAAACVRSRYRSRALDYATVAHVGLITIGIGIGTTASMFAALLHLSLLVLARCALLSAGAGSLTLAAGLLALANLPPFGLFVSLFLLLVAVLRVAPLLAVPIGAGVLALIWGLLAHLPPMTRPVMGPAMAYVTAAPGWVLLGVLLVLGLAMPNWLHGWLTSIATALT